MALRATTSCLRSHVCVWEDFSSCGVFVVLLSRKKTALSRVLFSLTPSERPRVSYTTALHVILWYPVVSGFIPIPVDQKLNIYFVPYLARVTAV